MSHGKFALLGTSKEVFQHHWHERTICRIHLERDGFTSFNHYIQCSAIVVNHDGGVYYYTIVTLKYCCCIIIVRKMPARS